MESDNQTHRAGSLFVLHDELDYPLHCEVSPLPAERINMPFMAFIRGVYEVNRSGWYVPHGKICCYDMTGERLSAGYGPGIMYRQRYLGGFSPAAGPGESARFAVPDRSLHQRLVGQVHAP